ncbi:hypothetical protein, conserved [Plasmodium gonderi]|uniref:Tetratricopeptide repeat protein n=1 Tax=Plasmodium gonderi TaxID=77519 RepID=A0A1Y1JJJ6_PLAGO|nr:hypothetical protein, conserved [Plasmodium gonderi]GAW81818.1 hypothetical protein, conserved [Plasmodium gonderi]
MMGGEVIIEKNPEKKFCVARKEPLCDSVIWDLLQNYYRKAAINAWKENVVPSFVTSNSKIAKDYARVIINYMRDWFNSTECDRNVPIYILEIGAGHGKFTYLILRALTKYQKYFKSMNLPERPFVYVFTDIAKDNITYCMNNARLKRFINTRDSCDGTYTSKNNFCYDSEFEKEETINYDSCTNSSGYSSSNNETNYSEEKNRNYYNFSMLDFAYFDGNETNDKIYLQISKNYIPSNTPIVLICNYVLDSLLTDAWIVNGENDFRRALLSVYSPNVEEDKTSADIMLRMSVTWDWEKVNIDEEIKKEKAEKGEKVEKAEKGEKVENAEKTEERAEKPSDYLKKYPDIYKVLKLYSYFNQTLSFVLPVGAFILFNRILKLSNNKLLCLIGDKGYQSYEEFRGYREPHIVVHGSLSFMVNLHAICLYFLSLGGYYIHTPYSDSFQIVTLLMHNKCREKDCELKMIEEMNGIGGGCNSLDDSTNLHSACASDWKGKDKIRERKHFCILDYFKKNSQEMHLKKRYQKQVSVSTSSSSWKLKENTGMNRSNWSKRSSGDENVYKKMKKINLKNLNNMSIKFGGTISSFFDNMEQFPPDILISWQKAIIHNINNNPTNVSIKELISLLRYSNHDSDVFFNIRNLFTNLASYPNINGRTEKDILLDIKECYENYYSLKNDEDIADVCGHVCMKFGEFEKSIYYMKQSLRNFKNTRHSSTYINIASCYKVLRNYHKSIRFIKCAIKMSNKENKKAEKINKNGLNSYTKFSQNNINHSYDLLYNIQFCLNPITYAIVGINYFVQNDGLYYLSFENRIKLKYIFLLSREEESVLTFMNIKYKNSAYEKSTRNMDLSEIKVVKIYNNNEVVSMSNWNNTSDGINKNIDSKQLKGVNKGEKKQSYKNITNLKKNLVDCLTMYKFQFCVIDVPWVIKADIAELMLENSKHIFTYGTLSDSSKRCLEVISKYKKNSKQISWVNNNYIHDECLYEAKDALKYIKNIISVTVTHYSMNLYNNQNDSIPSADILTEDLCTILNILQIVLHLNVTGLTANFLKKQSGFSGAHAVQGVSSEGNPQDRIDEQPQDKLDKQPQDKLDEQLQDKLDDATGMTGTSPPEVTQEEEKKTVNLEDEHYVSLSGILIFQQQKNASEEMDVHGNYLLMNNRNEEFLTKINFVGVHGSLCLKKTLSNWSVQVFNSDNEKVIEKSGRIAASQNSNDVFISQYLIKTDGKCNGVKHFYEYDLKGSGNGSNESIDSDIDILEISSDEEWNNTNKNGSYAKVASGQVDAASDATIDQGMDMKEKYCDLHEPPTNPDAALAMNPNCDNIFVDKNLEYLKNISGKRFYSIGKEVYENINIDESYIDVTVNNNCFYSRIVEGIQMSHKKGGIMVNFRYNSGQ